MAYGIEIVFFQRHKKNFANTCLQSQMPVGQKNIPRADFFQETLKKAPPIGQGAW